MRNFLFTALFLLVSLLQVNGQVISDKVDGKKNLEKIDSISSFQPIEKLIVLPPLHRNVLKFNPTPMMLFEEIRNLTFSYERLFRQNQSFSVQLGYLVIPQLLRDTVVKRLKVVNYSKKGINVALDYRYYPSLRNRRPAPDGMYVGGYLSYYGFMFNKQLEPINSQTEGNVNWKGGLNMINAGIELGYQFIFWKKFSVDLLMFGPSVFYFKTQSEMDGKLDNDMNGQIDEEFAEKLYDRFPALEYLFGGETTVFSGSRFQFGTGFRYSIQLGFHF